MDAEHPVPQLHWLRPEVNFLIPTGRYERRKDQRAYAPITSAMDAPMLIIPTADNDQSVLNLWSAAFRSSLHIQASAIAPLHLPNPEPCRHPIKTRSFERYSRTPGTSVVPQASAQTHQYSCDCSDALLKLKVVHGGFLSGPSMWSPKRQEGNTKIVGRAYTVKYALLDDPAPKVANHYVGSRSPRCEI